MENMTKYYETKDALQRAVINGHDHRAANVYHYLARKELSPQQAAKVIYDALAGVGIERKKLPLFAQCDIDNLMFELSTLID